MKQALTAKRAPEGLQGLEWVVRVQRAPDVRSPPLRGPVGSGTLPGCSSSKCPSLANKGEI